MQLIIHGDNTSLSRQFLIDTKTQMNRSQASLEVIELPGSQVSLTQLIQACEATSFFAVQKLIIIEKLFRHPKKKVIAQTLAYLSQPNMAYSIILWEDKIIPASQLKKLPSFSTKLFRSSPYIFKLSASLYPGNQKQFIPLLDASITADSAEFVFYMLCRHLRLLLQLDSDLKLPSWQLNQLKTQASRFPPSALISLHDRLSDLDWRLKSGQTVGDLTQELKVILLQL